jgi:plastocyanin domain-containing protein
MYAVAVNAAGLVLIGFIVWWFWLSRPAARRADTAPITVVVEDGVYSPARIEVAQAQPVMLRFLRKDPSPCAAKVIFSGLGISADLPIGEEHEVHLKPLPPGEYEFTCEMRMYRGSLLVK